MNISVHVLSAKPVKFYRKACKEYEKRLGRYCKIKISYYKKAEKLYDAVDMEYPMVVIDKTGKQMSSEKLAEEISGAEVSGTSRISVVIADSFPEVAGDNVMRFAVSRMDLSKELETAVVLEQIYRAYKIIGGETYHK